MYLFAVGLKDAVFAATGAAGLKGGEPLLTVRGADLENLLAVHPFYDDRDVPLVLADYVMLDSGTGCVHTAPGHGVEDYETGVRYGIEIYNPVDDAGVYEKGTPFFEGMPIEECGKRAIDIIAERGRLLGSGTIMHSYPHCLLDIPFDTALPLLRFVLAHLLPVVLNVLVFHVVEFIFTVTGFGSLKIRIKRMPAVYTAYPVRFSVAARIVKIRVFVGTTV